MYVSNPEKEKIRDKVREVLSERIRPNTPMTRMEYMRQYAAGKRAAEKAAKALYEAKKLDKAMQHHSCGCQGHRTQKMERALQAIQGYAETWAKEHAYSESEYLFMSLARQCEEALKS